MANFLTIARIALIIPFAALFMINTPLSMIWALAFFVLAAVTDFFDGYLARKLNQTSALGAALDPLADKLLIIAALFLFALNGALAPVHTIAMLAIILREVLVTGLREAVVAQGGALPVTGLAKWKTTAQLIAVGLLIAAGIDRLSALNSLAIGALWTASILTIWTGADYTARAIRFLNQNKSK